GRSAGSPPVTRAFVVPRFGGRAHRAPVREGHDPEDQAVPESGGERRANRADHRGDRLRADPAPVAARHPPAMEAAPTRGAWTGTRARAGERLRTEAPPTLQNPPYPS